MRVHIKELREGCILSEDVFSLTNRPIVSKKTILTDELIHILEIFLIKEVEVEKLLVNGTAFIPTDSLSDDLSPGPEVKESIIASNASLEDLFLLAVQEYKKEFKNWQSGLPIDISKVRNIMLPLIEKAETKSSSLFSIHHLSTNEEYVYQHSVAVGLLSAFIGRKLKLSKGDIVQLAIGGCLSDCGMAKIDSSILFKNSALTLQEFEEIKRHPAYSYKMVQNISLLRDTTKLGIFQHHERLDGSGYPFGEQSNKINTFAKIIGVADTFHAMTCNRLYRRKQSPFKVLEMMLQDMFGKYDIAAMQAIGSGFMTFSIGSNVKLSDGQTAEILFIDEKAPTRPLVKIISNGEVFHLEKHRQLYIEEVLK
ncbi:HD-GYP domain-containing protein [Cytobacillus depressus]|uniref:HD-GYP domain-containing protein n=1 Tax=Cytobacillus depressus TaxID=1602942 RepID=UPI001FE64536|nr:HD-GYP domain-containing protein [Cytobacillus depressus]